MNARQLRLVRAAVVSTVATLLAAVSHTLGGGAAPHPLLILAVATLLTPLSAVLVGLRRSRVRVAVAVVLSQTVFHVLFQGLGSPTGASTRTTVGHTHVIDLTALGSTEAASAPGATMLLAHAVAAALTVLLVWRGETTVRAVARWVEAVFRRAVAAAPAEHPRPPRLRSVLLRPLDTAVSATVRRRGPPALVSD
ncbi:MULTISPECIES: hypothetical protein [unclassified Microbacterium]|uniref:hypothetical protein n=1 Tax=unclassified Microbacterium TaxID=2609290 RepID=UPI0016052803|nr:MULTISPECIES: hypothetical protein [unclassified Microbacterium]QNA92407.1 hypothetical protein G4G29_08545 [Microbacterium sp. Se63.02b]QYM65699.1 hypothetical protein K1X59_08585 [Microbacterium sp. Se5.02b]